MSLLKKIKVALLSVGIKAEEGTYPDNALAPCVKVAFTGTGKPISLKSGKEISINTFKIIVRSDDCHTLIEKADLAEAALKKAGFLQSGEYEDVEPEAGNAFMQLALNYKSIGI